MNAQARRRFGRQIRLADVGEAGQERLLLADASPRTTGFARVIEERYLFAAGLRAAADDPDGAPARAPSDPELGLRHVAAAEVGAGAWQALVAIRRILEEPA